MLIAHLFGGFVTMLGNGCLVGGRGGRRGVYLGVVATVEEPNVKYHKSVVIKGRGMENYNSGSADDKTLWIECNNRFRWPLSENGSVYLETA